MTIYRVPQSDLDETIKNRIVSLVRYYTIKEGGVDTEKVNVQTLISKFSLEKADILRLLPGLIAEGKIEEVT